MLRDVIIALIQLSLLCWRPYYSAVLPKWVYRVDSSCPNPSNFSQWIEASKRLNCYHNLTSTKRNEQAMVYHCLPSSFLNETVEFCGRNVPISPGSCPIYNYEIVQNTQPTSRNCTDFISGCPTNMFHSKEVYKHPACLKLNTQMRCFAAEENCTNESTTTTSFTPSERVTSMVTPNTSRISSGNDIDASSPDSIDTVFNLIGILAALCAVNIMALIYWILCKRKYNSYKCINQNKPPTSSDTEMSIPSKNCQEITEADLLTMKRNQAELYEKLQNNNASICSENGKRLRGLTETCIDAKRYQYKDFLQTLTEEITPDMFNNIKCRLKERKENNPDVVDSIHEPYDLLLHLEEKYNVFYNLKFLQGIFLSCKAWKLFDRCVEYAKTRGEEIEYFERRILESDHTKVTYIINCPNVSEYNLSELEKLRSILEVFTKGQYDDIIVAGVKTGCVIVTLMIRNCLIPKLRKLYTSEKGSMTCQWMLKLPLKYKIMKVMIQDDLIYMSDAFFSVDKLTAEANLSGGALKSCLKSVQEKKRIGFSLDKVHKTVECNDNLAITLEKNDLKKDKMIENEAQQLEEFTAFLERTSSCITDDTLHSMKTVLKDFMDPESVVKMNTTRMLSELSELFKLQYNMSFLEWIFEKCGEHDLVEKCQKFSTGNHFQLECFNTSFISRGGNQQLQFQLVVLELKSYTNEIQDLRKWVAKAIPAHPGQIIMTALESEPIVVTFMMSKKHAKAFLKFLDTDDGQIAASRKRIKGILNNGKIIKIAKALNGSNFVHVHLRYQRNTFQKLEDSIRRATHRIIQHTGLQMEGHDIYVRTNASDSKGRVSSIGSSENYLEKNKEFLLEEIEPMDILEKSELASVFDTIVKVKMSNFESRKEKADYFLGICNNLPPDKKEMVVIYLKKSIPNIDSGLNSEELGFARCWIRENRKTLLDEIDSDFIKTTIKHMEDVQTEVRNTLLDTSYGRGKMAQMFLEFVLKKDDYVLALYKTWKENGINFERTE